MPSGQNLIGDWTALGTGTMTVNATTKAVSITPANDTTPTTARQQIATEIGKRYWFTYELQTPTQMWRSIGTTPGGGDILSINVSTVNETKFVFTATTASVWLDFARTSSGLTTVGNVRLEEYPPGGAAARRLNGRTQYFKLDAAAAGLRTSNSHQYIGGWFKFQYVPTAAVYLMDFAIPDAVATGGQQRARIFYDPGNTKIAVSNGGSVAGGNKYVENWVTASPGVDTWHYIAIILAADGNATIVYDGAIGGTVTATGIPEVANYLTVLHLGSRNGTTPTLFAPVILADWVWCAGFAPTVPQIQALAAGSRPSDIAGFTPSFYWPLEGTTVAEPSAAGVAELTANTVPANVVGPQYIVPLPADILPLLMF